MFNNSVNSELSVKVQPLNEEMPLEEEVEMIAVDEQSVVLGNAHDQNDEDNEDGIDRINVEIEAGEGQSHENAVQVEQKWINSDDKSVTYKEI